MATIYKIEIKTVSAFNSYSEEYVEKMFKDFIENYRDEKTNLKFESTDVKVKIIN